MTVYWRILVHKRSLDRRGRGGEVSNSLLHKCDSDTNKRYNCMHGLMYRWSRDRIKRLMFFTYTYIRGWIIVMRRKKIQFVVHLKYINHLIIILTFRNNIDNYYNLLGSRTNRLIILTFYNQSFQILHPVRCALWEGFIRPYASGIRVPDDLIPWKVMQTTHTIILLIKQRETNNILTLLFYNKNNSDNV